MSLATYGLASISGAIFTLVCAHVRSTVTGGRLGVAWPASMVLLGFVTNAVFTRRLSPQGPPRHRCRSLCCSVPLKALCCWCLVFALTNMPPAGFLLALAATLAFVYAVISSGFAPALFALFSFAVLSLFRSILVPQIALSPAGQLVYTSGVLFCMVTGSALGLVLSYVQSRGWDDFDGFLAVVLMSAAGFAQNIVSPDSERPKLSLWQPLMLFFCGVVLHQCCPRFTNGKQAAFFCCSTILTLGVASLLAPGSVFGSSLLPRLGLLASFVCTVALVSVVAKKHSLREDDAEVVIKPSLLFSRKTGNGTEDSLLHSLLRNPRERKLTIFLLLTLAIMLLEFAYGVSVNSLGLVSDSFHMMLDAASIAIGLCAAHAASWKPDEKTHPFGYGRYELLGGFVNGVLLLFIAFYVMLESIERIIDPPEIEGPYLLLVSVIGLVVNVVGVAFFHDMHGHSHSHDHGHDHGHGGNHTDHNMRGVYLHILADLLGSVSVILSSIFIHLFDFWIADPICSALSATLILLSAFPLLEETGKVLLLSGPPSQNNFSESLRQELLATGLLTEAELPKIWMHSTAPREFMICLMAGKLRREANYVSSREALLTIAEKKVKHELDMETVNFIINLE